MVRGLVAHQEGAGLWRCRRWRDDGVDRYREDGEQQIGHLRDDTEAMSYNHVPPIHRKPAVVGHPVVISGVSKRS